MNVSPSLIAATLLIAVSTAGHASEAISVKAGCAVCHAVTKPADKKMIGPSYQEIAARYKGRADAAVLLVDRVRKGGKGAWGQTPMAATPADKLGDADLKALVAWILKRT